MKIPASRDEWEELRQRDYNLWERAVAADERGDTEVADEQPDVVTTIRAREKLTPTEKQVALSEVAHAAEVAASKWCSTQLASLTDEFRAGINRAVADATATRRESDVLFNHLRDLIAAERRAVLEEVRKMIALKGKAE
jgi:hypothetical protein